MISPNLKALRLQQDLQVAQEQLILEYASGKHHRIHALRAAQINQSITDTDRDSALERACDFARVATTKPVVEISARE